MAIIWALALATSKSASPQNVTICGLDAAVCPDDFSNTKEGCCVLGPSSVCCQTPLGSTTGLKRNYCCPHGSKCSPEGCSPVHPEYSCGPSQGENCTESFVCAPGPLPWTPVTGIKNIVVMGDSVSIGWTPELASLTTNATAQLRAHVNHSPASGDGGARSTSDILQCFRYRVAMSNLEPLPLTSNDVFIFNAGLHDYNLGPAGVDQYATDLANITVRLQKLSAKLLFVGTTPAHNTASLEDDKTVQLLNKRAAAVMAAAGVPMLDLYDPIIAECGSVPWSDTGPSACSLCAPQCKALSVHYTSVGYKFIAEKVLKAILKM